MKERPRSADTPRIDTRNHILDVAERLFAEQGISATSLRQLTTEAGVNVAAVHYHFGSRAGLIAALFERRLGPMNTTRLETLDALEARGEPELEEILDAFVAPAFALCTAADGTRDEAGERFVRILGSSHTDPGPEVADVIETQFAEIKNRYLPALQRALPHLSPHELFWRMNFVLGAMARTLTGGRGLERIAESYGATMDWQVMQARLVAFACAGLRAPALETGRPPEPSRQAR